MTTKPNPLTTLPALIQAEDWPRAEKVLRRAADAKGASAEVYYNLAKVLEAGGKAGQRTIWLRRAVAKRPDYAMAWFELGRAALEGRDFQTALEAFGKAATLDPMDCDARRNLGRVALRLCDWEGAKQGFGDDPDLEARLAWYRIRTETGEASPSDRDALLSNPSERAEALRTLTRVAKGSLPLRL